jgi:hypothetical protein
MVAGMASGGVADAAITGFALSPTSGPPGTVVSVSGTGCSPGLTVSGASDYVTVTAPTLQISTTRIATAANGSWHGSFTVPAGAKGLGLGSLVAAVCTSNALPSLTTLYTPQTFTVTAPPAVTTPTTPTTPTTKPHGPGTTTPPTNGGNPPVRGGPTSTVPVPGGVPDGSGANPGSGGGNGGSKSGNGGSGSARPGPTHIDVQRAAEASARAADLSTPELPAADTAGAGGLGWLAWLLLLALVVAAVGTPFWLRRSREPEAAADAGDGA